MLESKDNDLDELKAILKRKENEWSKYNQQTLIGEAPVSKKVSLGLILVTALLAIVVSAFATYSFMNHSNDQGRFAGETSTSSTQDTLQNTSGETAMQTSKNYPAVKTVPVKHKDSMLRDVVKTKVPVVTKQEETQPETYTKPEPDTETVNKEEPITKEEPVTQNPPAPKPKSVGLYTVNDKAYFHNEPNESSRRNAFVNRWNNAILAALNEENNFIYVVYTNKEGETSKGWLRKSDLSRINR